ncbi:DUF6578 domain-containing protein [Glutamicibacter sp.]|uniref:DUF6578 domain-containing protein n=1 Tax=Glutamicibacter sp. TaxID=1931995 RepID=UPI002FDF7A3B
MLERYFTEEWEWECCGGDLLIGQDVQLCVEVDSEYAQNMRAEFTHVLPEALTGVETHHDDDPVIINGRVVALHAVIADVKWTVTPRTTPDPVPQVLGDGVVISIGNTELGQAEGENVKGTSRLLPVSTLPDRSVVPEDSEPDCSVLGEQIRADLSGYVITIEVD